MRVNTEAIAEALEMSVEMEDVDGGVLGSCGYRQIG